MARISTYPETPPPALDDFLLGTDVSNGDSTQNFIISDILALFKNSNQFVKLVNNILPTYANNSDAISGGLVIGSIYKTVTGEVRIVV